MDIGPEENCTRESTSDSNAKVLFDIGTSESSDVLDHGNTDDEDMYYPMKRRGLFVLFNHEKFDFGLPQRKGTNVDKDKLATIWRKLGFEVKVHDDLTKTEIDQYIEKYSASNAHAKFDCFACAFLTHGKEDDYIYARDTKYCLREVIEKFKHCGSLVGKPKLFFIQACRGRKVDDGKIQSVSSDVLDAGPIEEQESVKIPTEADVLLFYSTVEEYFSWRNQDKGSWFVQKLVSCLEKYWKTMDLLQILTFVNGEVGMFESDTDSLESSGKKQSPSIVSRLTRLLRFEELEKSPSVTVDMMDDIPDSKAPLHGTTKSENGMGDTYYRKKEEYYMMKLNLIEQKLRVAKMEKQLCEMKLNSVP